MAWEWLIERTGKLLFQPSHGIRGISNRNIWSNGKSPLISILGAKEDPVSDLCSRNSQVEKLTFFLQPHVLGPQDFTLSFEFIIELEESVKYYCKL